jgi:O-antigen ligase
LWSSDPSDGLRYVTKYRYLLLVPMVATAVPGIFRKRAAAAFQIGAIASVILSAAILIGALHLGSAHPGDPSATMAHLDYTLVLALCSLLALTRALYGANSWNERAVWLAAFAVTASGLLFNIGRSGQLGFGVGLGVLLLRWAFDASWRVFAATFVFAVVGVIAVWVLAPPAVQRMSEARHELHDAAVGNDYQSNIGGRMAATVVAARIVREHPFLGTGVGGNMPLFRRLLDTEFQNFKPAIYWYRHFHNQYAQIASELGAAGLASLTWIFWVLVRGPYRSRGLAAAASVVASVYLVGFLGEPFFHKQIPLVAFALVTGLISGTQLDEMEHDTT